MDSPIKYKPHTLSNTIYGVFFMEMFKRSYLIYLFLIRIKPHMRHFWDGDDVFYNIQTYRIQKVIAKFAGRPQFEPIFPMFVPFKLLYITTPFI